MLILNTYFKDRNQENPEIFNKDFYDELLLHPLPNLRLEYILLEIKGLLKKHHEALENQTRIDRLQRSLYDILFDKQSGELKEDAKLLRKETVPGFFAEHSEKLKEEIENDKIILIQLEWYFELMKCVLVEYKELNNGIAVVFISNIIAEWDLFKSNFFENDYIPGVETSDTVSKKRFLKSQLEFLMSSTNKLQLSLQTVDYYKGVLSGEFEEIKEHNESFLCKIPVR